MKVEDFAQTPEANEYLEKLQTGKIQLPVGATAIEKNVLSNLQKTSKLLRQVTTNRNDIKEQMKAMENQLHAIEQEAASLNGELTGYAKLLLSAENERRNESGETSDAGKDNVKEIDLKMPPKKKARGENAVGEN